MTRAQRTAVRPTDEGTTLIEILVALVVLAIITSGVFVGATVMVRMTGDNRARQVATNLAEQDLEAVRTIADPFNVHDTPTPISATIVSGRNYYVTRTTSWLSAAGADVTCGNGTNLYLKRVTVKVTWDGELPTTAPVHSDTVLAPLTHVADAATGAIAVRVRGEGNTPESGVSVTISPIISTGALALSTPPPVTDVDGCSYATQITPGAYTISITRANSLSPGQQSTVVVADASSPAVVTAGSTLSYTQPYDNQATFPVTYVTGGAAVPTNLDTTFVPVNSDPSPYITTNAASSVKLYPSAGGYTAIAGSTVDLTTKNTTCQSEDPAAWPAGLVGVQAMSQGQRGPVVATAAGTTARSAFQVPMGVISLRNVPSLFITAVPAATTGAGNPGCTTGKTYTFPQMSATGAGNLALPFGSWTLYSGTTAGAQTTQVSAANITVRNPTGADGVTTSGSAVIVTLDPR